MGPRNAYKDMLNNMVSPIDHVVINHQIKLEEMTYEAMFAKTIPPTWSMRWNEG
jgi:hypothetical protein